MCCFSACATVTLCELLTQLQSLSAAYKTADDLHQLPCPEGECDPLFDVVVVVAHTHCVQPTSGGNLWLHSSLKRVREREQERERQLELHCERERESEWDREQTLRSRIVVQLPQFMISSFRWPIVRKVYAMFFLALYQHLEFVTLPPWPLPYGRCMRL